MIDYGMDLYFKNLRLLEMRLHSIKQETDFYQDTTVVSFPKEEKNLSWFIYSHKILSATVYPLIL